MNKAYWFTFSVSLILGLSAFFASDQWLLGVGVGLISMLIGVFYIVPCGSRFVSLSTKRHECYLFIHGFLITLSVCMSLEKAFDVATTSMGKEFHKLDETLSTMQPREKVDYLVTYFDSDLYRMFLSILRIYLDRGGDVLKLSSELTAEASRVEETEQAYQKQAIRKMMTFVFLWLMSVVIVVFMRFGLSTFFETMKVSLVYLGSLSAFYLFMILSFAVYCHLHTGVRLWNKKKKEAMVHETS